MPAGITSINLATGLVVTNFGVSIMFNGVHEGHIWITIPYHNCVEGKNRELYHGRNVILILSSVQNNVYSLTDKCIVEFSIAWCLPMHSR